jgi:hypothetical protein
MDMKDKLIESSKFYCNTEGINEDTIETDYVNGYSVTFGDYDTNGYKINIGTYSDNTINRIIMTVGKNMPYIETREQYILDEFLSRSNIFFKWMDDSINIIQKRYKIK